MSYESDGEKLLERAARPTLEVIAWLRRKVPPALEPLLDHLRERFYEPGYSVAEARAALRLASNWFIVVFKRATSLTPWRLVRQCRLETAARLLRDTDLTVLEVTLLVGYDSEQAFTELFVEWCGMRPVEYRDHARALAPRLGVALEEVFTWARWQRFREGRLAAEESAEMVAILEEIDRA